MANKGGKGAHQRTDSPSGSFTSVDTFTGKLEKKGLVKKKRGFREIPKRGMKCEQRQAGYHEVPPLGSRKLKLRSERKGECRMKGGRG